MISSKIQSTILLLWIFQIIIYSTYKEGEMWFVGTANFVLSSKSAALLKYAGKLKEIRPFVI